MNRVRYMAFSAIVASCAATFSVQYKLTPRDVVAARVTAPPQKNTDRGEKLRSLFADAGCPADQLQLQPVKHSKAPNVICTIPGEIDSRIVVGAHFDHTDAGMGVIDDWSGATLLPDLLESIRSTPRRHTFLFIGFTDEEKGLVGSQYYVGHLDKEDLRRIAAMVDFDSVGTGPAEVEVATADQNLLTKLLQVTGSMKLPMRFVNVNQLGTSDFAAFRAKKVPSLILHSITQENWRILHTNKDTADALRMDDYYDTYGVAAVYLAYLDMVLDPASNARR